MQVIKTDGGRVEAGLPDNKRGDCVIRAIAIAAERPYAEVRQSVQRLSEQYALSHRSAAAKAMAKRIRGDYNTDKGNFAVAYEPYILSLGFEWVATMKIGTGCRVHLRANELPMGRLIVKVSKHLVAVIDRVIHDTHDCSRNGTRCVYGYWRKV